MTDKEKIIAYIDKLLEKYPKNYYLLMVAEFIDKLEVKEANLEKELIKWHKQHFKKDGTFIGMSGFYLTNSSQMDIAKHFFELGLVQNNIENDVQKQKERLLSEIEEAVDSIDYYTVDGLLITIKQKIEELRAQKGE